MSKSSTRTNVNIVLLLMLFPIYRLWHMAGLEKVSYWLEEGFVFPIEQRWYFKFLSEHIAAVILAVVVVRLSKMRLWLEVVAIVWLFYRLYDLGAFLYNFNRSEDYVMAYSFVGLATALVYCYRTAICKLKNKSDYLKHKIESKEIYQ